MRVVLSAEARSDLQEIADFIARDNQARARTFARELRRKMREIGDMPGAFPLVPRFAQLGIRRRVHRDYLIFYRVETDRVFVVHVLHAARDYEVLLAPGS